jgi:hypothetical protein
VTEFTCVRRLAAASQPGPWLKASRFLPAGGVRAGASASHRPVTPPSRASGPLPRRRAQLPVRTSLYYGTILIPPASIYRDSGLYVPLCTAMYHLVLVPRCRYKAVHTSTQPMSESVRTGLRFLVPPCIHKPERTYRYLAPCTAMYQGYYRIPDAAFPGRAMKSTCWTGSAAR